MPIATVVANASDTDIGTGTHTETDAEVDTAVDNAEGAGDENDGGNDVAHGC